MVLWQLLRCENEYIMEEYTELFLNVALKTQESLTRKTTTPPKHFLVE